MFWGVNLFFNRKLKFFVTVELAHNKRSVRLEERERWVWLYLSEGGMKGKKHSWFLLWALNLTRTPVSLRVSISVSITGTEVFLSMLTYVWLLLSFVFTGLHLGSVYSTYYSGYWHHFRGCYRPQCFIAYHRFSMGHLRAGECSVSLIFAPSVWWTSDFPNRRCIIQGIQKEKTSALCSYCEINHRWEI